MIDQYPDKFETGAARYWVGRVYEDMGNRRRMIKWYNNLIEENSLSFYAYRALERMKMLNISPSRFLREWIDSLTPVTFLQSINNHKPVFPDNLSSAEYSDNIFTNDKIIGKAQNPR